MMQKPLKNRPPGTYGLNIISTFFCESESISHLYIIIQKASWPGALSRTVSALCMFISCSCFRPLQVRGIQEVYLQVTPRICSAPGHDLIPVRRLFGVWYTLPTDQLFNLEFQFESVFNLEFQPKFGIQLGIPISMGINLGECIVYVEKAKISVYVESPNYFYIFIWDWIKMAYFASRKREKNAGAWTFSGWNIDEVSSVAHQREMKSWNTIITGSIKCKSYQAVHF